MKQIHLKAMAKINLGLDVVGERQDGYHDLRMIMQTVRLYDRVKLFMTRSEGVRVKTNLGFLPTDRSNHAYMAAQMLIDEFGIQEGVFIDLQKHIPVAAGLAGGSSDAAAVLVGMNLLFGLGLSEEELRLRGVRIGADVPYCILRGTALAEGIGDVLTPLPAIPECWILIAKPDVRVWTKYVYTHLKLDESTAHPDIDGQIDAIRRGDLKEMCSLCGNVLERVTEPAYPKITELKKTMTEGGALVSMMSGSGPSVFGIFDEEEKAQAVYDQLRGRADGMQVFLTNPFFPRPVG